MTMQLLVSQRKSAALAALALISVAGIWGFSANADRLAGLNAARTTNPARVQAADHQPDQCLDEGAFIHALDRSRNGVSLACQAELLNERVAR